MSERKARKLVFKFSGDSTSRDENPPTHTPHGMSTDRGDKRRHHEQRHFELETIHNLSGLTPHRRKDFPLVLPRWREDHETYAETLIQNNRGEVRSLLASDDDRMFDLMCLAFNNGRPGNPDLEWLIEATNRETRFWVNLLCNTEVVELYNSLIGDRNWAQFTRLSMLELPQCLQKKENQLRLIKFIAFCKHIKPETVSLNSYHERLYYTEVDKAMDILPPTAGNSVAIRGLSFFFPDELITLLKPRILHILEVRTRSRVDAYLTSWDVRDIRSLWEVQTIETAQRVRSEFEQKAHNATVQILLPGSKASSWSSPMDARQAATTYFPPCMRERFNAIGTEPHLKNYGRFQFASFCSQIGISQALVSQWLVSGRTRDREAKQKIENQVKYVFDRKYKSAGCTAIFKQPGLNQGDGCPLKTKGIRAFKDDDLPPETKATMEKHISQGHYCNACSLSGGLDTVAYSPFTFFKARVEKKKHSL